MEHCKFCGAELPEDARFCPVCEKELIEKTPLKAPRLKHRRAVLALLALALLLAGGFWLRRWRLRHEPQIYNAGAPAVDMQYTAEDGVNYRLFLSFAEKAGQAEPCEKIRLAPPKQGQGQLLSLLCAVPEGGTPGDGAAFGALIDYVEIRAAGLGGSAALAHGEAAYDADWPYAPAAVTLHYDTDSWYNELGWILHMKNGDIIYLHQYVHVDLETEMNNAGAPAFDMQYTAEDGVNYRIFLTCAETAAEAEPCELVPIPFPQSGKGQFVSLLCAAPEGGTLTDGAAFGELIEKVDLRVGDMESAAVAFERFDVPHEADRPFAAAAVTLDYDEGWGKDELLWIIRMKNRDVLYLHQFVAVEQGPQIYNFGEPAYDMEYTAEDGVRYRLFLTFANKDVDAGPSEIFFLPAPKNTAGQVVSKLCAQPEGGKLWEGAAFGDLIEQVDVRVGDQGSGYVWSELDGAPFKSGQPFAAAAVALDNSMFGSRNELLWILHMKNGDLIYLHQFVYVGAQIYNAGAPVVDMRYTAEDGVNYRLFLSFAETAEEAKPCEEIHLPLPESGKGQLASLLCAVPEGAALEEGAAFGELIERVELRAADRESGTVLFQHFGAPQAASRSFAAAEATPNYDERWSSVELAWVLYMKDGDVIYLHQFVYVGDAGP